MAQEIPRILAALAEAEVRFLVVGGVAVVLHGVLRLTADLDLVVALDAANVERALAVLGGLRLVPVVPEPAAAFANAATREEWASARNMLVFTMWNPDRPSIRVDLFIREPFEFEAAWARRSEAQIAGATVPIASIEDLVAMKATAGRPKDLEDIRALRLLSGSHDG